MKQCTKCKKWKSSREFFKEKKNKDGFRRWCKTCNKKYCTEYRNKNRKKIAQYNRQYRLLKKEKVKSWEKRYRKKHKRRLILRSRKYRNKNRKQLLIQHNNFREKRKKVWVRSFKKNPKCEVCEKRLQYFSKNHSETVCFDHKNDKLPIKMKPSEWLYHHYPTPENVALWKSCNFGILCSGCNYQLPTKNRKKWLKRIIKYIRR